MITMSVTTLWLGLLFIIAVVAFTAWKITHDYWRQQMSEKVIQEWEKWKSGRR